MFARITPADVDMVPPAAGESRIIDVSEYGVGYHGVLLVIGGVGNTTRAASCSARCTASSAGAP